MSELQNKRMLSEPIKLTNGEVDLVDVFRRIVSIRKIIYKAVGVGLILGVVVALSVPKQYTVRVTLSPEMGNGKGNNALAGFAASFLGSGASMGEGLDALNASLSSDIASSTPFLLELLDIEVSGKDDKMTLSSYLEEQSIPWWNYILGLPGITINSLKTLLGIKQKDEFTNKKEQGTIRLTREDSNKINYLKNNITVLIDKKTAITSISVTLQDPMITAVLADSVIHKLQEYIIDYRTSKAKEDCAYLEKLFNERQLDYYTAQRKYADYVDTHDNLILQSVRTEQERLQNDMNIAYQVYSQVANQLEVARAKVQEEKPVFAVVEPAVVPLQPSGMGLKMYILLFVFFSVACTIVWMLWGKQIFASIKERGYV